MVMTIITMLVDRRITKTFVKPSISLAMTNARVIDEEQKVRFLPCYLSIYNFDLLKIAWKTASSGKV